MPKTSNILVVEDDPDTQANLCDILELDGYSVSVASSVAETLAERDWDDLFAVILDRRLPDGTADDLLPEIRTRAPRAAVIVVTGHADLDGAVAVIRHGIADFIPKPVEPDMLRASLFRVARLQEAEERALQSERLAAIGQMLASLAHESRNALQRIQVGVEMLRDTIETDNDAEEELRRIENAADGLHGMLEDVRGYSAPMILDRGRCSVADAWRLAWSHLETERSGRNTQLLEDLGEVPLECNIDLDRLSQVFRNMFENSLAACDADAIIQIRCEDASIHGTDALAIIISDSGPGLTDEQRQHVFDAFFTTKHKGTGLGMAIVKRIIEAHEGQVESLDVPDCGATFRICLPR